MLLELRIRNLAVIDSVELTFGPGLTALTGETGAGKSVIVGALSLLVGERASAEVVRDGAARAVVEGVFDVSGRSDVAEILDEHGLESDDGLLVLRREVAVEGRNRAWVNGSATTVSVLGTLGALLVDLHGQHEHQTLLRPDEQRAILDAYAGADEVVRQVAAAHARVLELRRRMDDLERRRRDTEQRADVLREQLREIDAAALKPDEETALEEEARRLEHAGELAELANGLYQGLYAAEDSVTARLDAMRRAIGRLTSLDPTQAGIIEAIDAAYYALEDVGRRMADYATSLEHDPRRLDEVHARRDLIYRLRRKYGPSLEDVLETARRARAELDALDSAALDLRDLGRELEAATEELQLAARELTERRRAGAAKLSAAITALLPEVGIPGGRFEVRLLERPEIGATGAETVEFVAAMNQGFEARPLARTASGGELSRVMLAMKTVLARLDRVTSLVFDEVDAGIGGRVARQVGEKLREVASTHQVFVITHLAQIAALADHHLHVEKVDVDGTVRTRVIELTGEDRVREVARMLAGDAGSLASLEHARELLAAATRAPAAR